MNTKHFHIFNSVKYIHYALILCVVPMLNALFKFDWKSFFVALQQDALILLASLALVLLMWAATRYSVTSTALVVQKGIFVRQSLMFPYRDIAVVETVRPLLFRLFGASAVTLYFSSHSLMRHYKLVLNKKNAEQLAKLLLPQKSDVSVFEPSGADKLSFVMLSANMVTSTIFAVMAVQRVSEVLGSVPGDFAKDRFTDLELFLAHFLPAGLSFVVALLFLLFTISIVYSIFRTAGFKVSRNGGVMLCRGGLITKTERRILCSAITSCDVRVTPPARLLRRYPVFICAGSYHGSDTPVFAFKSLERSRLEALLPEFVAPHPPFVPPYKRNIFSFIWPQITIMAVLGVAAFVLWRPIPAFLPVLLLPALLAFFSCLNTVDGYGRENLTRSENRTLSAVYTRFFTRHEVCVLTADVSMRIVRYPIHLFDGRCDVYLALPYRRRLRIRSVRNATAQNFTLLI